MLPVRVRVRVRPSMFCFTRTTRRDKEKRFVTSHHDARVVFLFQTQKSTRFNTSALTNLVKRLYARCGIIGASSHSGRRTFITKLATSGVSVRVIAEAVGHSSIATTQRYIDVNDELISNAVELV